MTELWFLVRTVVDNHWACAGEQCVYGEREKLGGSLEIMEIGAGVISNDKSFYENFETHSILQMFLNSWYLTGFLKAFPEV